LQRPDSRAKTSHNTKATDLHSAACDTAKLK
jgi:hypothetical protein